MDVEIFSTGQFDGKTASTINGVNKSENTLTPTVA
jgi:hypothetical protein